MPHHVFLSYSRKDKDLMQRIRDDLRAQHITVWTDDFLTPGTDAWNKAIEQAIEDAGCIVVILSPDAKESLWVNRELAYALSRKSPRRIFPVLARGDENDSIPIELIRTQRINFQRNYNTAIQQLIGNIRNHLNIATSQAEIPPFQRSHPQAQSKPKPTPSQPINSTQSTSQWIPSSQPPKSKPAMTPKSPPASSILKSEALQHPQLESTSNGVIKPLIPWLPWNQFRLLWWLFIHPGWFVDYRNQIGEQATKKSAAWLASTIIWLPLLIPILSGLGTSPTTNATLMNISHLGWSGIVAFVWLTTIRKANREATNAGFIFGIMFIGTVVGVAGGIAGIITIGTSAGVIGFIVGTITLTIALSVAESVSIGSRQITSDVIAPGIIIIIGALAGIASAGGITGAITIIAISIVVFGITISIVQVVKTGLQIRRLLFFNIIVLIFLALSYAVLIWIYWLGGWRVLSSLS